MAEGILEPQESLKLNFNQSCVQSPLLHRLWASAVLCCLAGQCPTRVPHALGTPAGSVTLCPKKPPGVVSKHTASCPGHRASCPPLPSQLLGTPQPAGQQLKEVWEWGRGLEAAGCGWAGAEAEESVSFVSSAEQPGWFLFPGSLGDSSEAAAAAGISVPAIPPPHLQLWPAGGCNGGRSPCRARQTPCPAGKRSE